MRAGKARGSGCETLQHYTLKQDGTRLRLKWLPEQQLISEFKIKTGGTRTSWKLLEIRKNTQAVAQKFIQLGNYSTTDYTDIGDNESDPFLMKMINLGFVEHGASGFYDSSGRNLRLGHRH